MFGILRFKCGRFCNNYNSVRGTQESKFSFSAKSKETWRKGHFFNRKLLISNEIVTGFR